VTCKSIMIDHAGTALYGTIVDGYCSTIVDGYCSTIGHYTLDMSCLFC